MWRYLAAHPSARLLLVWLFGPWLARALFLNPCHRACLARSKRLIWDVIDHPALGMLAQRYTPPGFMLEVKPGHPLPQLVPNPPDPTGAWSAQQVQGRLYRMKERDAAERELDKYRAEIIADAPRAINYLTWENPYP